MSWLSTCFKEDVTTKKTSREDNMKFQSALLIGLGLISLATPSLARNPQEIASPVEKIFVPNGFDDNDSVEIVLHGEFPNSCYRTGKTGAKVDYATSTITVWGTSYLYEAANVSCAQVITPFIQVVKLGVIKKGTYNIVYKDDSAVTKGMLIKSRLTESADDYLYAPVENASIKFDGDTQILHLQGYYPYMFIGCMKISQVQIIKDPSDVLVVLPITEILNDEACADMDPSHYFEYEAVVETPLTEEGLLHVRVLNGNSVNQYVKVPK
jgi:hypothetical protein